MGPYKIEEVGMFLRIRSATLQLSSARFEDSERDEADRWCDELNAAYAAGRASRDEEIAQLESDLHAAEYRSSQAAWDALTDSEKDARIKWAMNNPI